MVGWINEKLSLLSRAEARATLILEKLGQRVTTYCEINNEKQIIKHTRKLQDKDGLSCAKLS